MSKLEKLIQQLCPDGVEFKQLGEIASYSSERIGAEYVTADTYVGVDNLLPNKEGKTTSSYVPASGNLIKFLHGDILIGNIRPYLKKIWLATCSGGTNGDVLTIHPNNLEEINSKFLYYVLSSDTFFLYDTQNAKGAKMPRGNKSAVLRYCVPVPPLPVQREIVRILDSFTELTAELTARKKQYEYYRDKLLTFEDSSLIAWMPLGEIAAISRGASPRPIKSYITSDGKGVNWIKISDASPESKYIIAAKEQITMEGAKKSRYVKPGDFILSNSMSFGRPYILKIDGCIHDGWLVISDFGKYITPDYLYYTLTSTAIQNEMKKRASFGGAVQNLNADIVRALSIPIPPLDEQRRIVSILDRFDALCNDLTQGLPAEIEARKKQYEYYRDKLLSFPELTELR